jgi:monoamine oxidase
VRDIGIIGGGPGGLLSAYQLERRYRDACRLTLFEATKRVGGKIHTRHFDAVPIPYESGTAECYDYSSLGKDPLRELVASLGLATTPTEGSALVLDGAWLQNERDVLQRFGAATLGAIQRFRERASSMLPVETWLADRWQDDNAHPWARRSCEDVLNDVDDPIARKYLKAMVHSDLATEPHLTSGLNGLKNFLMDVPGYVSQYSIDGGMGELPRRLRTSLTRTRVELESEAIRIEKAEDDRYRVLIRQDGQFRERLFDALIIALPLGALAAIDFSGERLRRAMSEHVSHYDRPGHYLRVSVLFDRPFWRDWVSGSWFMSDAFGGCCLYDESARHNSGRYGVLGFLLAGNDALSMGNRDDTDLVDKVLKSLPDPLYREASEGLIEARVHRWANSVSAQPGGTPLRNPRAAHNPEPRRHPGLFIVGDYLFDSTLNGVYDSAVLATDCLCSHLGGRQSVPIRPQSVRSAARVARAVDGSDSGNLWASG